MALLFVWNDSYKTGVPSVDTQHKKLVDLINDLYAAMGRGQGNQVLGTIAGELVKYTVQHFSDEERLMEKAGYPDLAAHKLIHKEFTARVTQLQKDLASGKFVMSVTLANYLKDWLSRHILGTDRKYIPFVSKLAK